MKISVKAKPGSKRGDTVIALADGSYEVHIKAKPVDGKANDAIIKLLAKHFGLRQNQVKVVLGSTSRLKVIEIEKPA